MLILRACILFVWLLVVSMWKQTLTVHMAGRPASLKLCRFLAKA